MPVPNNQTPIAMDESRMVSQRHNLYKVVTYGVLFVLGNARRKPQMLLVRGVSATLEHLASQSLSSTPTCNKVVHTYRIFKRLGHSLHNCCRKNAACANI